MKKYLIIALFLIAGINRYAATTIEFHYNHLIYILPLSYLYLSIFLIFITGWLLAYQWQLLKIYLLSWQLKRVKKELRSVHQKFNDQLFLVKLIEKENNLFLLKDLITSQPKLPIEPHSIEQQVQELFAALDNKENGSVQRVLRLLERKLPQSLHRMLMSKTYLMQLPADHQKTFLLALKKWPQWMWSESSVIQNIFEHLNFLNLEEQEYILRKINPVALKFKDIESLEQIVIVRPSEWLTFFYQQHWQDVADQSFELVLFLVKLNAHLGFIGQARSLVERLPASFLKAALVQALAAPAPAEQSLLSFNQP